MESIMDYISILLPVAAVAVIIVILLTGYVKASPDTALIISGMRKKPRFLIGKAGIKIPFFEKKDELSLRLVSVDVKTSSPVPTADYININVDSAVNVKIGSSQEMLEKASQNFLNCGIDIIGMTAREVLEGNMREIIGQMELKEMVSDRQKFAEKVKDNAVPDLGAMGLEIISFNVQNFVDDNEVIENLGIDNISKIKKSAAIARAESEKEVAVAKAQADKEANDARVASETEIAIKNNQLEIRKAELKKEADLKKAEADAIYKIEEQEQRKQLEIANANIAKQEREVELKTKEVEVREKALDAEVRKKAEADRFAREQDAEAELYERKKDAEAKAYEAAQEADALKATAQAARYQAEQEAAGVRAKGEAEATAIQAKALAEAAGIEKKAEAMAKMGEAAILEMYFKAYPEVAKSVAEPLSKVDSIVMYGDGNSAKLTEDIVKSVTQVDQGLQKSMGLDIKSLLAGVIGGKVAAVGVQKENDSEDAGAEQPEAENHEPVEN